MITYEQRINSIAQKHADKWNKLCDSGAEWTDTDCIEDAKVTVAAQTQAIREFNNSLSIPQSWCEQYLLENGYLPLLVQEGGEDEKA